MEDSGSKAQGKREQALLSWIQQFSPYGVFTLDASLRVQSWNRWMELHSALTSQKAIGLPLFELFPELAARKLTGPFLRALAGESSTLSTALHRHLLEFDTSQNATKDDPMRQTARLAPLIADGEICGVVVVIEDVTQRETQAASLVKQHRRDEALSWALVNLLKAEDPKKTVRALFFKIAEQLDFDTFFLYLRSPEGNRVRLDTSGGVSEELQLQFRDYEVLSCTVDAKAPVLFNQVSSSSDESLALLKEANIASAIAIPLRAQDRRLGVLCFASGSRDSIAHDESELLTTIAQYLATALDNENTSRELRKFEDSNQWMAAMVESSDDAIISKDLNGVIKSCNRGASRLFGYEINELIGKPMRILIPNDHQDEEVLILQRIRSADRIEHFETIRQRKDGSIVEVSMTVSPVMDRSGVIIGASNIARDISERRKGEQELAASFEREKFARERAEIASRAKDDFLAALSHELRTPLNPVLLLASEAAEDDGLPEPVRAQFATIRNSVELEARLIDDLLDITRITHGKLSLNVGPVDVGTVLSESMATVQSEINKKRITLTKDLTAIHATVNGDAVRLQQVFWNILQNAVKFTPEGGRIQVGSRISGTGKVIVSVEDSGIGMSSHDLTNIFEAFTQGEHGSGGGAHRFGGLGLGLAISRKLVESHAGTITAGSQGINHGSIFTVTLPLALEGARVKLSTDEPPLAAPAAPAGRAAPIRILLVEDHEPTRTALAHLLARRRYEVTTAASVTEARVLFEQKEFHLLVSDIGLPDGNGFELMKELLDRNRALQGIALTGYGMEHDVARGQTAGFGIHLTKPVRVQSLDAALATITSRIHRGTSGNHP